CFSSPQRAASASRTSLASASSRSIGSRTGFGSLDIAASSISSWRTRRSASSSSTGDESISIRSRDAASSTRSIALSGRKRSVMRLVRVLEAAQDRDRVGDRRLTDEDRLEAPLEGGVLLDVLAVLVERRRTDAAELAAGEHRLQHVRGVDGAFRGARADDRVQLVDEEDQLALGVLDLVQHRLQPLFELAAVLGAGEEGTDVERPHALALQAFGD